MSKFDGYINCTFIPAHGKFDVVVGMSNQQGAGVIKRTQCVPDLLPAVVAEYRNILAEIHRKQARVSQSARGGGGGTFVQDSAHTVTAWEQFYK